MTVKYLGFILRISVSYPIGTKKIFRRQQFMKEIVLLVLFLCMASVAGGEVSTIVYEANGSTPFDGRDIMVGTKLTIIVSSDTGEYWPGDLTIEGENMDYGVLSARDYNETTLDYKGSRFKAAGDIAVVWYWEEPGIDGFNLTADGDTVAGNWFLIDYTATDIGDCNVTFYEWWAPMYELSFVHVRTRDFNDDTMVDLGDFAIFALYWQTGGYSDPCECEGADIDADGNVDSNDLMLFSNYWLETTEYNVRTRDFNNDTEVDFADFSMFSSHWQETGCCNPDWCEGADIDTDGNVDSNDLRLFADYWLETME